MHTKNKKYFTEVFQGVSRNEVNSVNLLWGP